MFSTFSICLYTFVYVFLTTKLIQKQSLSIIIYSRLWRIFLKETEVNNSCIQMHMGDSVVTDVTFAQKTPNNADLQICRFVTKVYWDR